MPADLTLPVSRLPGVVEVARKVLGLDPWIPGWPGSPWEYETAPGEYERVVPLTVPAGRLVAETWLTRCTGRAPMDAAVDLVPSGLRGLHWPDWLHAACLYLGDLLRVAAALGVEVPAGTVPRLERANIAGPVWCLHFGDGSRVDFVAHTAVGAEVLVPALAGITDPRAALDAIVKEALDVRR